MIKHEIESWVAEYPELAAVVPALFGAEVPPRPAWDGPGRPVLRTSFAVDTTGQSDPLFFGLDAADSPEHLTRQLALLRIWEDTGAQDPRIIRLYVVFGPGFNHYFPVFATVRRIDLVRALSAHA